jgi:hypothetical protein
MEGDPWVSIGLSRSSEAVPRPERTSPQGTGGGHDWDDSRGSTRSSGATRSACGAEAPRRRAKAGWCSSKRQWGGTWGPTGDG